MMYFRGASAMTAQRQQALFESLKHDHPELAALDCHYAYLVSSTHPLDPKALADLTLLLPQATLSEPNDGVYWVKPRAGVLSPFAAKATEVAQAVGLSSVTHIECLRVYHFSGLSQLPPRTLTQLYDPLTEMLVTDRLDLNVSVTRSSEELVIPLQKQGMAALERADEAFGLALSLQEAQYLLQAYQRLGRDPTPAELMMFAQVNSEHCRHKIFNSSWVLNGVPQSSTLFSLIKSTYKSAPQSVTVAYRDNAAVLKPYDASYLSLNSQREYEYVFDQLAYTLKVETHNHPTAISPFAGAATGCGGEIRDEAATGRGAESRIGLCGFSVSHLRIPGYAQPWEGEPKLAPHLASPLEIMIQGPLGAAAYNNEFGRPNVLGYFRNFEMPLWRGSECVHHGYHKPIMLAGGLGQIRAANIHKRRLESGDLLLVLGGPGLAIGLGGGAASSRSTRASAEAKTQDLDFSSVQRANPEMERRAQEVINQCLRLGEANPILAIHDVGAGGLSNALPELVHADRLGAWIDLDAVPSADQAMLAHEIWCNEAQERYVLAIQAADLPMLQSIATRERCPLALVGHATAQTQLVVVQAKQQRPVIDLPMAMLFDDIPLPIREDQRQIPWVSPVSTASRLPSDLPDAIERVLRFPAVASKNFLITIGDRSVGGLVARDQLVGPYQVPVADCAVVADDFLGYGGQAMALGERPPLALIDSAAAARMALGEALTNLMAADVVALSDVVLSANWMGALAAPGEGFALYEAVRALCEDLCPRWQIPIPVGKDSLSMQVHWPEAQVRSPLSLIITATAKVGDVRRSLTPALTAGQQETQLIFIDLGEGDQALGGSVLWQCYQILGEQGPDVKNPDLISRFFTAMTQLKAANLITAYHDRSDGGLLVCLIEMMIAGGVGLDINLDALGDECWGALFNENLGACLQVKNSDVLAVLQILGDFGLGHCSHVLGLVNSNDSATHQFKLFHQKKLIYEASRIDLHRLWQETSYQLQAQRDNPDCAREEHKSIGSTIACLTPQWTGDSNKQIKKNNPSIALLHKPRVAIFREQGINGQREMAAAFTAAGFDCVDLTMSDLLAGRDDLQSYQGLVACGGFSYGDVLGAGRAWAQTILQHASLRDIFAAFFADPRRFSLGVCNGCQMMAHLKALIPGAAHWPIFQRNRSEQFEARLSLVQIEENPSVLLKNMQQQILPVVVSHGEGRASFSQPINLTNVQSENLVALRYVDGHHQVTEQYPLNPNGSLYGIGALTSSDGRATIMMPHPERVFRTSQLSWHPESWVDDYSPWFRVFQNAYDFVA